MHFNGNFDNYIYLANYYNTLSLVSEPGEEVKAELNSASHKVRVTVNNCEKQLDYLKQQFQKIQQIHSEEHKKIYVLDFLEGLNMPVKERESKDCPELIEIFLKQIEELSKSVQAQLQLPAILPSPTKRNDAPFTNSGQTPLSIPLPTAPPPPPPFPTPSNGGVLPRVKIIPSAEPTPATTTPKPKPGMQKGFGLDPDELLAAHKKIKGNTPLTEKRNDTPRRPAGPQTSMQNPASPFTPSTPHGNGTIHPGNEGQRTPLTQAGNTSQGTPLVRTPYRVSNQGPKKTTEVETPTAPITFNGKVVKTRERSFLKKGKTSVDGDPKSPSKKAQKEIEEAGVDVKKIIARLEALFKQSLENNQKTVHRLLENILNPENNPMLKEILQLKSTSGPEEILGKIKPVFEEVAAEVISDFNACWITKNEFSQFSEEEANALLLTPDKLLRKVPEGMSISILLRDAWLFRSYAKCLDLNYQRHSSKELGKAPPETEEIEVALNLFKYFFKHLEEIEQIEIYAEAGKTIRGKEMQIVELIKGKDNVSQKIKQDYIEKGGLEISCSESFFDTTRVKQPEEDKLPDWLKSNLS